MWGGEDQKKGRKGEAVNFVKKCFHRVKTRTKRKKGKRISYLVIATQKAKRKKRASAEKLTWKRYGGDLSFFRGSWKPLEK